MQDSFNTWNSRIVLSHVVMPYAFAINLGVKSYETGLVLLEGLIGGTNGEIIRPGIISYNGDYTELTVLYGGTEFEVQSAVNEEHQYILVTPVKQEVKPAALLISASILWNCPGYVRKAGEHLEGVFEDRTICVYSSGQALREVNTGLTTPYICISLTEPVAISTRSGVSAAETAGIIKTAKKGFWRKQNVMVN